MIPSFGTGYYLHIAYAYLIVAAGIGLLGLVVERASAVYRRQTAFLILGALPPFVANIAFTLRISLGPLPAIDPTPFTFAITGVLFGLALFRFDLLERTPIARQRVLDEMGDGLVVLDADGEVVDTNAIARRVFDPSPSVGDPVTALVADDVETTGAALEELDGRTLTATLDGRERTYDLDWSPLTDHRGETVGHAIGLRDVTDRSEYEQRLEVAQRVLRHNLRNDINVIRGWADALASEARNGESMAAQRIVDTADDLIGLSEKTRTMVRLDTSRTGAETAIDAHDRLTALVREFRDDHPEVTIENGVPESVVARLPDAEFLDIPVRNLLENAIEHNDTDEPWVRVSGELVDDRVRIHIEDNGPEIPAVERETLEAGTEDELRHGSGVGLWLTYWSVKTVGGSVDFDAREPRGNVVTVELPAAERPASHAVEQRSR